MAIDLLTTAWLAGLLEGEGSFSKCSSGKQPRISVAMTDKDTIETAGRLMGAKSIREYNVKMANSKTLYAFEISGTKAKIIMRMILPFMHSRRKKRIEELLIHADGKV